MSHDLIVVLSLLLVSVVMFTLGKPRVDVVAIIMVVALSLTGILSVDEVLSGFSDPNVILIAAMFILGAGLVRTGLAHRVSDLLVRKAGNSETRLLVMLMLLTTSVGSIMSSTGVVAIFMPVVLSIARKLKTSPSRLMMPLGFAGLISGMMTLVATPPNMVIQSELVRSGYSGFHFFSFTPIGIVILLLCIGYMLMVRKRLGANDKDVLPSKAGRTFNDLIRHYKLAERERRLLVTEVSSLINANLGEIRLRTNHGINLIAIERLHGRKRDVVIRPESSTEIHANDILLLDAFSPKESNEQLCEKYSLKPLSLTKTNLQQKIGMAEILIPPESNLIGKTIIEIDFRNKYNLNVIGLSRDGQPMDNPLETKLVLGDVVLVVGSWKAIRQLQTQRNDFLVLNFPAEIDEVAPALEKAPHALFSLAVTVVLMVTGLVPNVLAGLIGCLLMIGFKCIDLPSLYKEIHWPSLILIAGMLPIALALQKTGGIMMAADVLMNTMNNAGLHLILGSVFVLTALAGLFISNTVTAVLMAPMAIAIAEQLEVSPYPFAMIVALAASSAFMTPVSSPVTTLVASQGNYKFMDFIRIGVPFTILVMIVSVILVPVMFPF